MEADSLTLKGHYSCYLLLLYTYLKFVRWVVVVLVMAEEKLPNETQMLTVQESLSTVRGVDMLRSTPRPRLKQELGEFIDQTL